MEEMPKIKIGGREIPMKYTCFENIAIQDEIGCTGSEIREKVFGLRKVEKDDDPDPDIYFDVMTDANLQMKFAKLVRILGNAGLEESGMEPDLTEKWILRNIRPGMIFTYVLATMAVVNQAYQVESIKKTDEPVDETVEEENAKKTPGN